VEERTVQTVLGRVRVEVAGDGAPILFWPSLLMTGSLWRAQVEHFSATHTTVAIDPRGHGGSEPLSAGFSFGDCARVIEQILDDLGFDSTHFVGNSWGGMIGATFAATLPERTRSCVLMNCTASPAGRRQRIEYGLLRRAAVLRGGLKPPLTRAAVDAFLGPTSKRSRPETVEHVRRAALATDIRSVRWAVRSVVPERPDQRPLLSRITAPTLVIAGDEDATFPVAETREMADRIPGARFTVIDGAAHLVALEVPERVNALIGEHLDACSTSEPTG
jgi:3-oxoadipate enol-lactonase